MTLVDAVTATQVASAVRSRVGTPPERALRILERNMRVMRTYWLAVASGFVEPVLLLLSLGVGVGELVGTVPGPGGRPIAYDQFVAPAMLANAAMNGAILDTTFNFFVKFKYSKAYDAMLATPLDAQDVALGEVAWSLLRGAVYAVGFLVVMALFGLTPSFWAVLGLPIALLVGFAFAGAGLGATTYMRSYLDFDKVGMVMVPLFLFSATFFPLERYPDGLAAVIRWTPLYQGVVLTRSVTLGDLHAGLLLNALYLLVMGWVGTRVASRRIAKLLQP
ncbi:MAG TPA: ABC transporter permease [Acidimicrobiales bacterium]|nr:ABC transporter permease [Acidimicrobiales bacterium]